MMHPKLKDIEKDFLKGRLARFSPGDTVQLHYKSKDQEKERVQIFEGIVIARKGGGLSETVTIRKVVQGEGVERIFPLHSPRIAKIVVKKRGGVRRAKLYYLRELAGRKARVEEIFVKAEKGQEQAEPEEKPKPDPDAKEQAKEAAASTAEASTEPVESKEKQS
jgi:large subunit ribosomal protein L19